ncbi:MAG: hypothetical protein HQK49_16485 [Oligoflexia bacterium]|nr:hypothetical protein [Oligoflexia bacterium]
MKILLSIVIFIFISGYGYCLPQNDQQPQGDAKKERVREGKKNLRVNCTADVKKFCKGLRSGNGAIKKCLNEHHDELSVACRDTIDKIQRR